MGRAIKRVLGPNGTDRRETGYYATPEPVAEFLGKELLRLLPHGNRVLDPAVGKGELLAPFVRAGKEIDGFDIAHRAEIQGARFFQKDFLSFYTQRKLQRSTAQRIELDYDFYIANPPYNCHEVDYIKKNKPRLRKAFAGIGVHNMYSMFLAAMIDLAKEGAMIGVVISDSFLSAAFHSGLRQLILDRCSVKLLALCPQDLFHDQQADVRTCLLILRKGKDKEGMVKVSDRAPNTEAFFQKLKLGRFDEVEVSSLTLGDPKKNNQFVINVPSRIRELFEGDRIGDRYRCVTGISTGNDSQYLSETLRPGFTVPFFKNPGKQRFHCEPQAFLTDRFWDEGEQKSSFTIRNKDLVYREGITCSSMGVAFSACYLPAGCTFGVNPNIFCPPEDLHWLLAWLNSSLSTYLVRRVLIRSNMVTSGYISQLPVIQPDETLKLKLESISKELISRKADSEAIKNAIENIDTLIFDFLDFDSALRQEVTDFASNLYTRV